MIIFPRPFAIAIDDLGWIQSRNEGESGYGPYRIGIERKITLDDYKAVVDIAQKAGVRLQGLFIMGEMDRENILGAFPTTTHMRENWDNTPNISELQIQIMEYVKAQSAYLEFGLHGVGHEFWPKSGVRRRAEWYNTDDHQPWPEEEIRNHILCFVKLMEQYGIGPATGHSFPESFVPCAYSYHWNPNGPYSSGSILSEFGVRYANTDFTQIPESNPPLGDNGAGFDHYVHVMNRYNYGNTWHELNKLPTVALENQPTDYIETHWPNLLAQESEQQNITTDRWVNYFKAVQRSENRYCSKNTSQHHSQWLYKKYCSIEEISVGEVIIDNSKMPSDVYRGMFPSNMVLKIKLEPDQHLTMATIDNQKIPAYFEEEGFAFLYLPQLLSQKYNLKYDIGSSKMTEVIWHNTTSNIVEVTVNNSEIKIDLCLYGSQTITLLKNDEPQKIESNNPEIKVIDWEINSLGLAIQLIAHDMQGEIGSIKIYY